MTDKLPEEVVLDRKVFHSWKELLIDSEMTCCLVVFENLAQNLGIFFCGQLQLFESVLDEVPNRNQCSCRVGETDVFNMGGAQANLGDQL